MCAKNVTQTYLIAHIFLKGIGQMFDSLSGMSYSLVGILAILVLLIENNDVIFNRNRAFVEKSWKE